MPLKSHVEHGLFQNIFREKNKRRSDTDEGRRKKCPDIDIKGQSKILKLRFIKFSRSRALKYKAITNDASKKKRKGRINKLESAFLINNIVIKAFIYFFYVCFLRFVLNRYTIIKYDAKGDIKVINSFIPLTCLGALFIIRPTAV